MMIVCFDKHAHRGKSVCGGAVLIMLIIQLYIWAVVILVIGDWNTNMVDIIKMFDNFL